MLGMSQHPVPWLLGLLAAVAIGIWLVKIKTNGR